MTPKVKVNLVSRALKANQLKHMKTHALEETEKGKTRELS
jgi:hypothetical protein